MAMHPVTVDFPSSRWSAPTGSLRDDATRLLRENGKEAIARHSAEVAETCSRLAGRFGLDAERAYDCGILHDIGGIVKPSDMLAYAERQNWTIDGAERAYNFLLHQRISVPIAKKYFGVTDSAVLSAMQCHTTLKANATNYDMLLFLADKISWDQQGAPPYLDAVTEALSTSLPAASLTYINYALHHAMILMPHSWLLDAKQWLERLFTFDGK